MNKLMMSACLLLFSIIMTAQGTIGNNLNALNEHFHAYDIVQIDLTKQADRMSDKHSFHQMKLVIPELGALTLELTPTQLFAADYVRRDVGEHGEIRHGIPDLLTFKGYVQGYNDSYVGLTMSDDFINGSVRLGSEKYIIQNLSDFLEGVTKDEVIIFNAKDGIQTHPGTCGTKGAHQHIDQQIQQASKSVGECFEVEIALAADFLMFEDYGSANNVEDQIVGVLDDVQTNFDDEFPDEIQFVISEMFIVTSQAADPWTNSTNAGTLLDSFRSWGNSGGFGGGYDVASLWSDRDFDGGTIGVAWLDALCGSLRYNVDQDFTSNANLLRVLQAHELGHNFGSGHDASGSGTIMAPSVNNTNSWSNSSINQIENHYTSVGCLDDCSGGSAPSADFSYDQDQECTVAEVHFFDDSNGEVNSYFWEFEGGNPSTSTSQNPVVEYEEGGLFDVTLTVTNAFGSDEKVENNLIDVLQGTVADFDYAVMPPGNIIEFINFSDPDVIQFFWDFDDGDISFEEEPTHIFEEDGDYYVELEVYNGECEDTYGTWIEIATPPTAAFESDVVKGCVPLTVEFENLSSNNADDFYWEFEGGDPAFTGQFQPTVVYNTPGTYDVYLLVENETGSHEILMEDYITVLPEAFADFTYQINGLTASFTNTSQNYNINTWDFGDGEFSELVNPIHEYEEDGVYTVTLTVTGECGIESFIQEITITSQAGAAISQSEESGCLPLTVVFDGSNSNLAENFEWTFEGATPDESNDEIVEVTYDQVGIYDVVLIVSNAISDDTLTLENAVTVNDVPFADFNFNNNGLDYQFQAIPDGTFNTTYQWDFGDGMTASGENVNHVFDKEGIYDVVLIATNECGSSDSERNLNLYTNPAAAFTSVVREGCAPLEVSFTNESSVNSEDFVWSFPGGNPSTSTMENPIVTYESAGTYNVSLLVSNPAGEDEQIQDSYIIVRDVPVAEFSNQNDQLVVSFTDMSIDATSVEWDFGDGMGSSEELNPVYEFADEGEYVVTLTAKNECGSVEIMKTIVVSLRPTASFSVSTSSGCAPLQVTYMDASSSNVDSWKWEFPGGVPATSTEQNPTVTYDNPGTYTATLIVQGEGGSDTLEIVDVVVAVGLPTTSILTESNLNEVEFNSSNTDVIGYLWDFGDGEMSDESNPIHIYGENGTYLVSLSITDECGTTTVESSITIDVYATSGFSTDDAIGCPPFEVTFTQEASNAESFQWSFPGGSPATSEMSSVVVVYEEAGTYPVGLLVSNTLGDDYYEVESFITVGGLPTAAFDLNLSNETITTTNSSENGTSYDWDFGDGNGSSEQSPSHNYALPGTYVVSLTVTNECGSETATREVTIEDVRDPFINALEVLPNPNDGNFNLYIQATGAGDYDYFISDIQDRSVAYGTISVSSNQELYPISVPELASATYVIRIENGAQELTRKLVISH